MSAFKPAGAFVHLNQQIPGPGQGCMQSRTQGCTGSRGIPVATSTTPDRYSRGPIAEQGSSLRRVQMFMMPDLPLFRQLQLIAQHSFCASAGATFPHACVQLWHGYNA